ASLGLYVLVRDRVESEARLRFENDAADAARKIEDRVRSYADVLYSVRGLFDSDAKVTRRQFHDYVASLNLGARYPGFQIINFEEYVTAGRKAAFEAAVRRDTSLNGRGYPDFRIRPPGERPVYFVLNYVEPMQGNEGVFGADISTNNQGRNLAGLDRMRGFNQLSSSGRLVRIDGPERYVALSIRLPVYRAGAPTGSEAERRDAYIGSVGAGFRVKESLAPIIEI